MKISTIKVTIYCIIFSTLASLITLLILAPIITWSVPIIKPFEKDTIISFSSDDGQSNEIYTSNIMIEMGYRCTFYVITEKIEQYNYLSWNQLINLQTKGFEIGSHTLNHSKLINLSLSDSINQIKNSKIALENHGLHINSFSFPYDLSNSTLRKIANETYTYVKYNYTTITNSLNLYQIIDDSIVNKTLLNLNFHTVNPMGNILYNNHYTKFKLMDILSYLNQKNIVILTNIQAYYINLIMVKK